MRSLHTFVSIAASTLLITAASAANASGIDVQFSNGGVPAQTGAAVIGTAGDVWNDVTGGTGSQVALKGIDGTSSGVSLSFSSAQQYESDAGYTQFTGTPYASLMQGYLVDRGATGIDLSFSGLVAGRAYGLYVYTQGDDNSARRSIGFTVNGVAAGSTTQSNATTFIAGDNYEYIVTTANAQGVIGLDGDVVNGEGNVNGVQLSALAVPEPSSIAMMLAGFVGLAGIASRRSRKG